MNAHVATTAHPRASFSVCPRVQGFNKMTRMAEANIAVSEVVQASYLEVWPLRNRLL